MPKIKKNDRVVIIAGKDKGKQGTVSRILSNGRVLVAGANFVKKHQKPNPSQGVQGGIIEKEASLHSSNVALWNPVTKKPDRTGFKFLKDGKKARYFKSNNEMVDV